MRASYILGFSVSVTILMGCGSSSSTSTPTSPPISNPTTLCAQDITAGASINITAVPSTADPVYKANFSKYTSLTAPNGKPIHFYAQDKISNEQMIRARNILAFYLEDVPCSQYGTDKTAVFNQMANNNATIIMVNGSDQGTMTINGQPLYETETVMEGSTAYFDNEPRDAAFEEILHMMHDTGIGVDGINSSPGVLPDYQKEIRAATKNASPATIETGGKGIWASPSDYKSWLDELKAENSLSQEYLASVIDTYYGQSGYSSSEGSYDLYGPQNRDQIRTQDPMGWALVDSAPTRKFFNEYVTYEARVDLTDARYNNTFTLVFDKDKKYTYKSQYLLNVTLLSNKNTNLIGNQQANKLTGNSGNNSLKGNGGNDILDGGLGEDVAEYTGAKSEYGITKVGATITVTDNTADRDGTDTLTNIECVKFADDNCYKPE